MLLGAATVARHRPELDDDSSAPAEIPHLHSSGSSSSDDEGRPVLSNNVGDPTTAREANEQEETITHATTVLYMSPARTQYHKKILDRMGMKQTDDDGEQDNSAEGGSHDDRDSISMSSGSQDVLSKSSSMFFTKSFAFHNFTYPQDDLTGIKWQDRLYGLFTNYEDLGIHYQIEAKWKKANAFIVRFTSIVVAISITSLCFGTVSRFQTSTYPLFLVIECVCVAWLAVDLAVRAICTRSSFVCFWSDPMSMIDLVSLLPLLLDLATGPDIGGLGVVRVIRLIRTVRLMRSSRTQGILELFRAMRKSVSALSLLFFLLVITMFVSSSIIYLLDIQRAAFDGASNLWIRNDGTISPFQSIFHCMWFCLTTLTTVGYGDDVPFSPWAKAASAMLMVTGVLVIAFPTVILSASFHSAYSERFLTTLRNNLTDKQRESLAYGRNRQSIAVLAGGRNGFGFTGSPKGDTADGKAATFKGRLLKLMRKNSDDVPSPATTTAPAVRNDDVSNAAVAAEGAAPTSTPEVSSEPATTTTSFMPRVSRKPSGGSRWAILKKIAHSDASSVASNSQSEGLTSDAVSTSTKRRPVVSLAPMDEDDKTRAPSKPPQPPQAPPVTVSPVSPTTGNKSFKTVQDLEKRFAIPELGPVKIALIPFAPLSQSAMKSSKVPSRRMSRVRTDSTTTGQSADSDTADDNDTRGVVCASRNFSHRRKSGMTTQALSTKSLKMAERKARATATFGRDGVELCHSSTDSDASLSTSSDDEEQQNTKFAESSNPLGVPSAATAILTPNYSASPPKPAFRRSRAPTIVMARKSNAHDKPVKTETNIFSKIDASIEALNYNMQQLKSQMIGSNGVVTYPPKLKLMCVGGSSTLSVRVEQCFPPGSHSLCFTVVINDPEYHRVQSHLAMLSFGHDRVRRVELAHMHKLRVDLRIGNIRLFAAARREALNLPPLTPLELEEEGTLLGELLSNSERQLLDSCYLATTTYRNVIASTLDVVIMCPSAAAFKLFQRSLHLLKFTFDVQFRKPQFVKIAMNPQHAQNISIAADAIIVEQLRRKLRTASTIHGPDALGRSPARTEGQRSGHSSPSKHGSANDPAHIDVHAETLAMSQNEGFPFSDATQEASGKVMRHNNPDMTEPHKPEHLSDSGGRAPRRTSHEDPPEGGVEMLESHAGVEAPTNEATPPRAALLFAPRQTWSPSVGGIEGDEVVAFQRQPSTQSLLSGQHERQQAALATSLFDAPRTVLAPSKVRGNSLLELQVSVESGCLESPS